MFWADVNTNCCEINAPSACTLLLVVFMEWKVSLTAGWLAERPNCDYCTRETVYIFWTAEYSGSWCASQHTFPILIGYLSAINIILVLHITKKRNPIKLVSKYYDEWYIWRWSFEESQLDNLLNFTHIEIWVDFCVGFLVVFSNIKTKPIWSHQSYDIVASDHHLGVNIEHFLDCLTKEGRRDG